MAREQLVNPVCKYCTFAKRITLKKGTVEFYTLAVFAQNGLPVLTILTFPDNPAQLKCPITLTPRVYRPENVGHLTCAELSDPPKVARYCHFSTAPVSTRNLLLIAVFRHIPCYYALRGFVDQDSQPNGAMMEPTIQLNITNIVRNNIPLLAYGRIGASRYRELLFLRNYSLLPAHVAHACKKENKQCRERDDDCDG
jgi:hypothetical protein